MAMMAADVKTSEKVVWRAMMMTKMKDYDELEKKYGIRTPNQKAHVCVAACDASYEGAF